MKRDKAELLDAADGWDRLAVEYRQAAQDDRMAGIDLSEPGTSPGDHRARLAERTAKAMRFEAATGTKVCSCHLYPLKECPARQPARGRTR